MIFLMCAVISFLSHMCYADFRDTQSNAHNTTDLILKSDVMRDFAIADNALLIIFDVAVGLSHYYSNNAAMIKRHQQAIVFSAFEGFVKFVFTIIGCPAAVKAGQAIASSDYEPAHDCASLAHYAQNASIANIVAYLLWYPLALLSLHKPKVIYIAIPVALGSGVISGLFTHYSLATRSCIKNS